jgi:hypothetical protein
MKLCSEIPRGKGHIKNIPVSGKIKLKYTLDKWGVVAQVMLQ